MAFDLDDTLFAERDYLHSAWREIAARVEAAHGLARGTALDVLFSARGNAFDALRAFLVGRFGERAEDVAWMVDTYRRHRPDIALKPGAERLLATLIGSGHRLALVTDGRGVTQRAKIEALGLDRLIDPAYILISGEIGAEKLSGEPFRRLDALARCRRRFYVGDNPAKDFLWPRRLGWTAVMVRGDGTAIHPQTLPADEAYHPDITIDCLSQLTDILSTTL